MAKMWKSTPVMPLRLLLLLLVVCCSVCITWAQEAPPFGSQTALSIADLVAAPLRAVVEGQAQAALSTVDFIDAVGFSGNGTTRKPLMVDLAFQDDATGTASRMRIPFLTMLPIPSLNVRLFAMSLYVFLQETRVNRLPSRYFDTSGPEAEATRDTYYRATNAVGSVATRQQRKGDVSQSRYSMYVRIAADSSETPQGIQNLLDVLQRAIEVENGIQDEG